jgi:hypothetical protein
VQWGRHEQAWSRHGAGISPVTSMTFHEPPSFCSRLAARASFFGLSLELSGLPGLSQASDSAQLVAWYFPSLGAWSLSDFPRASKRGFLSMQCNRRHQGQTIEPAQMLLPTRLSLGSLFPETRIENETSSLLRIRRRSPWPETSHPRLVTRWFGRFPVTRRPKLST